jgi:hypothetical protein
LTTDETVQFGRTLLRTVGFFLTFPNSRGSRVLRKILVIGMKKETHTLAAVFVTAGN